MRYRVRHTTTYRYRDPVAVSHNLVHLVPIESSRQRCLRHELTVSPSPATAHERRDYYGNRTATFTVQQPHRELVVRAVSEIDTHPVTVPDDALSAPWEEVRELVAGGACSRPGARCAGEFAYDSPLILSSPALAEYARPSFPPGRPLLAAALELNQRIHDEFTYDTTATSVHTPVHEVLVKRRGVCQDFAHLAISCLRSLSLSARYVSGYLETLPPEGRERLVGADASHAWFSLYCPDPAHGRESWVDLDPTNDCLTGERHISVAVGRDFGDVSPLKGMILGGGPHHEVLVSVDVVPIASPAAPPSQRQQQGLTSGQSQSQQLST
jgi:transglutaminase-like putative cysteine protease